jgi:hypothetical protein
VTNDEAPPPPGQSEAAKPSTAVVMTDANEVLFRQIHPNLFDGDEPASSAFMPNSSDEGQLSVDRETLTTAQSAYDLYVGNGLKSGGTYGVTTGEFGAQELQCYPQPIEASGSLKANPAHARVDFSALGSSKRRTVAKRLKTCALSRGLLYKP